MTASADNLTPQKNNKKIIRDIVLITTLFFLVQWWREKDLLATNGTMQAPEFNLVSLEGETIRYPDSLATSKPALFYFFAPWCQVCDLSIENLNSLKTELEQEQLALYIIALDWRSKEEVEHFVDQHQLPVSVLLGTSQQLIDFQIKGFPTYYVANSQGQLTAASLGYSTSAGIKLRTNSLLNK